MARPDAGTTWDLREIQGNSIRRRYLHGAPP